jgi:hypothetical protein
VICYQTAIQGGFFVVMREIATRFEPIQYFAPPGRGTGGENQTVTGKGSLNLTADQIEEKLSFYKIDLGNIDLNSPRSRGRALGAIKQKERELADDRETVAVTPPLHEQIVGRIQTHDDSHAVTTYRGIWDHLRHAATDPKPNGHFQEVELSVVVPTYPLAKIDTMATRVDAFVRVNAGFDQETSGVAPQLDNLFTALDYKRRLVIEDTREAEHFEELALMGVDPKQIGVSWGEIHRARLVPLYTELRGIDTTEAGAIIATRRQMVDTTLSTLDKRFSNFFRHNPDISQQALLEFFRNRPRTNVYSVDETHEEQEAFTRHFSEIADRTLSERIGIPVDALPLSYAFLSTWQEEGVITPQYPVLEAMNRSIRNGEQIDLYCCPNYARYTREDGVEVYTFDGLEPGLGLTAERSFPFVTGLIDRVSTMENHPPVTMQIGIADFEATPANAEMVKLSIDGFKGVLGQSVEQMITYFQDRYTQKGNTVDVVRLNDETEPLGEWQVTIKKQGRDVASLSFGAITKTYEGRVDGYSQEDFDILVERKREELAAKALTDTAFQHVLDEGLTTRLGIMLDWPNGKENDEVKELAGIYNQMTETNFARPLSPEGIFAGLIETVNGILERSDISENEKDMIVRDITIKWLQQHAAAESTDGYNTEKHGTQALQGIRARTAEQLAEYAVMSILMKRSGTGVHFTADATAMWEMSGKALKSSNITTPRLHMKGGYEGA